MDPITIVILLAAATMLVLAVFMAFVLGWANKAFHVEVDPRVDAVNDALPGANCGGCGYVGCNEYAEAVVAGDASPDKCTVGGESCAADVAAILGVDLEAGFPYRPVVHCGACTEDKLGRHAYLGEPSCRAANLVSGIQGCTYGCLGIGDCTRVCKFDAIHIVDGLATVDYDKCVGCGACERACPRHIISMVPFKTQRMLAVLCSNHDFGKDVKAVCKVGCIGCKACARGSKLFTVENNLPRIDYDEYDPQTMDDLDVVIGKCPMKRLLWIGRPTEGDLSGVANEEAPAIARDQFDTTVDKTEWWG